MFKTPFICVILLFHYNLFEAKDTEKKMLESDLK